MPTNRFASVVLTLTADVANAGTFTSAYPSGFVQADFLAPNVNTADEVMIVNDNDRWDATKVDFAYGASLVTVTNNTGTTLKAGSKIQLQLARATGIYYNGPTAPSIASPASDASGTKVAIDLILAALRAGKIVA